MCLCAIYLDAKMQNEGIFFLFFGFKEKTNCRSCNICKNVRQLINAWLRTGTDRSTFRKKKTNTSIEIVCTHRHTHVTAILWPFAFCELYKKVLPTAAQLSAWHWWVKRNAKIQKFAAYKKKKYTPNLRLNFWQIWV